MLFASKANSQYYEAICKIDTTTWNYLPYGDCDGFYTDTILILSDTLHNDQNYFVLYRHGYFENDTAGYLREDTILGKLWYRESLNSEPEYLVMDLELEKNDTFTIYGSNTSFDMTVDTVYYDEQNRKHVDFGNDNMQFCGTQPKFEFIEGVGSTACHFYQGIYNYSIISTGLLCCHKENQLVYSNDAFSNLCYIIGLNVDDSQSDFDVSVYPNPSNGCFKIEFDNPHQERYDIKLYSVTGSLVYYVETNNNSIEINSQIESNGIYFYTMKTNEGMKYYGKISIEK